MFRKQLSPAKVKRDDVTFGGGEMLLDYQNSMEVKEELSGCDVSPHLMKPIFLAFCLQPRWFTHRCICWILIPTTTTKTLNGVFVEIPLQEDPGDQTYVTFPIGTSGFYSQVCRSSTTIFRDVKSSHHVASFGTGREGGIFLQPTIVTNYLYTPRWPSFLSQLYFLHGELILPSKIRRKKCHNKNITSRSRSKKIMPGPCRRRPPGNGCHPWFLGSWQGDSRVGCLFGSQRYPFAPGRSIAKRWKIRIFATWKTKKDYEKTAACFFCSTFPFFVTPEPRGMETRTSTLSRRMTRFNSPISCQLP